MQRGWEEEECRGNFAQVMLTDSRMQLVLDLCVTLPEPGHEAMLP